MIYRLKCCEQLWLNLSVCLFSWFILKPSTNDAQLLRVVEKKASGGVPLYQVEYKLDSARGVKRIFSAVTVAKKKLYILNVAFKDNADMPLPVEIESLLNQIVNSFDLLKW